MSYNPTLVEAPQRNDGTKHVFRVIYILGGIKASLLNYFLRLLNVLVIVIDNANEIDAIRRRYPGKPFITFVIGDGHTTRSQHAGSSDKTRDAVDRVANSSGEAGQGGRQANAERAAELLVASTEFQKFLQRLPDLARLQCRGMVGHVHEEFYGSLCGAVFGGGRRTIANATVPRLLRLSVPVDVRFNVLGSTTFAGLSERARLSGAVGLMNCAADVVRPENALDPMVSMYMDLHELRPSLDDNDERDFSLLQDNVALDSSQMAQYLAMVTVNHSHDNEFGNVRSRCVDFMKGLDPEREIASLTASSLRHQLAAAFATVGPDPQLVDEMVWQDESVPQERQDLLSIVDRLEDMDCDSLERALAKPPARYRFQIAMQTAYGVEIIPEKLSTTYALTPHQLDEFHRRMCLIRTFQQVLLREYAPVTAELQDVDNVIAALSIRFQKLHTKLITGRYWFRKRLLKHLATLCDLLRENYDRWHLLDAEKKAIERATGTADQEWTHHDQTVRGMESALDAFVPRGSMIEVPRFVVPRQLPHVFAELLAIAEQSHAEQIGRLCSFASIVNPDGLARILGSSSNRMEQLAERIVYGEYEIQSPGHGGRILRYYDKMVYAIPPMEPSLEALLRQQILSIQPEARVVFTDTLAHGATVMKIRFQRFSRIEELFEGLLASDMADAVEDPRAGLNSTDDFQAMKDFGGHIVDHRLEFEDSDSEDDDRTDEDSSESDPLDPFNGQS